LHSNVRGLAFGPQEPFEKQLGYAVAALEAPEYLPRDEDVYLMYGWPGRMVRRFTQHDDRTLFLFIFATDGSPLPAALNRQKAMLRDIYCDGKWETPQILGELERRNSILTV
jgi:hypothetical protein